MKLDETQKQVIRDIAADWTYITPKEAEHKLRLELVDYEPAAIQHTMNVLVRFLSMNGGLG